MMKIFTLASERSGTKYLSELFKYNIRKCVSKHEPYFDMFGKPIYWYLQGDRKKIRRQYLLKKMIISLHIADVYVETTHSFLKSTAAVAMEFFPDLKLIHLIRNPLETVKSQYNRPVWIGEPESPEFQGFWYTYKGDDGKRYIRWTLTGKERIYQETKGDLTRFQKLLLQWIEIENRAMNFLDTYKKLDVCYTLESPKDLNDEKKIRDMFRFFGLQMKQPEMEFHGFKNPGKNLTVISPEERKELQDLLTRIPDHYLTIFHDKPYSQYTWATMLCKE